MRIRTFLAAASLLLSGCAEFQLPGTAMAVQRGPIEIGPKTWAAYQSYLDTIGETGQGAFAIATDGGGGASWLCIASLCNKVNEYPAKAIARCEESNPGYRCLVLAINRVPQVAFTPPQ
jgi:hypothetical protein